MLFAETCRVQPLRGKKKRNVQRLHWNKTIDFEVNFSIKICCDPGKEFQAEFAKLFVINATEVYHNFSGTKRCVTES